MYVSGPGIDAVFGNTKQHRCPFAAPLRQPHLYKYTFGSSDPPTCKRTALESGGCAPTADRTSVRRSACEHAAAHTSKIKRSIRVCTAALEKRSPAVRLAAAKNSHLYARVIFQRPEDDRHFRRLPGVRPPMSSLPAADVSNFRALNSPSYPTCP